MNCRVLLLFLLMLSSHAFSQGQDPVPVHDNFKINSKILGETRVINVWKPADYAKNTNRFPVLYMADGGTKEDFPHVANTISKLIESKKIPPIILVGIENTQRRRDLTGPTNVREDKEIAPVVGGSEKFRVFFKEELFKEIDTKYRTEAQKGIIGESLAGLFIMETFLRDPEMFDFYIAMDPSLWWNAGYEVKMAQTNLANMGKDAKKVWFASSGERQILKAAESLSEVFKSSAGQNIKWQYDSEPKETHATIFRATKEKALIWVFNTK